MNIGRFRERFEAAFPARARELPRRRYEWHIPRPSFLKKLGVRDFYFFERFREVEGLISVKKAKLLNLAYGCLDPGEAYLEAGTWQGKSLIAAMWGNPPRPTFACDDYSEVYTLRKEDLSKTLMRNLRRYGLQRQVRFYRESFE